MRLWWHELAVDEFVGGRWVRWGVDAGEMKRFGERWRSAEAGVGSPVSVTTW